MRVLPAVAYRFIAFSTISGVPETHARTLGAALALALVGRPDTAFLEVLDCGVTGQLVWSGHAFPSRPMLLHKARDGRLTVFRGDGYAFSVDPLPAVPLALPGNINAG